jgi:hypothetical protein
MDVVLVRATPEILDHLVEQAMGGNKEESSKSGRRRQ